MTEIEGGCTLGELLDNDRLRISLLTDDVDVVSRPVTGVRLCSPVDMHTLAADVILLLLPAPGGPESFFADLAPVLDLPGSRLIAVWLPSGVTPGDLSSISDQHVVLGVPETVDPAEFIGEIARSTTMAEDALARRLTSLQRSLTQALASSSPLQTLTARLAKKCNAVVAVIGANGSAEHTTGPLPLGLLFTEISRTSADSHAFAVDGWNSIAVKIAPATSAADHTGWLLVASRRDTFPDPYSVAATYVAASLAETSMQIDLIAQRQERAVRSSVLEQALAIRLERHDAELAGKVAALGISFDQEIRTAVARLVPGIPNSHAGPALETMFNLLQHTMVAQDVPHLLVLKERAVVALVQSSASTIQRTFVQISSGLPDFNLGIGRDVAGVGQIVDSYHDAQLAIRALKRRGTGIKSMTYEEFDFATRLFSYVGLDTMAAWADELLRPIEDQPILLDGLRKYFEHNQNINAAAESLSVHHNSLRYRLSKIEETLEVSLRDPAALSSLFLALTALSMSRAQAETTPHVEPSARTQKAGTAKPKDASSGELNEYSVRPQNSLGAAVGPDQ